MADQKLTDLPLVTTPGSADAMYLVTDPSGTPASSQITLATAGAMVYGEISIVDATVKQGGTAATWSMITGFASQSGTAFGVTEDFGNNKLVLPVGTYMVQAALSVTGPGGATFSIRPYLDALPVSASNGAITFEGSGVRQQVTVATLVQVSGSPQDLDLRFRPSISDFYTVTDATLLAYQVSSF